MVEARRLKGAGVCFVWGRCFDFLPVLAGDGKRLRYMRMDKAVGRQLMGPCRTWDESFSLLTDGPERLEADAAAALRRDKPLWEAWFRETEGLAACLREAERQRDNPYSSWPTPDYVRAFLLAALGRKQAGMAVMEAELDRMATGGGPEVPGVVGEKLLTKLRGLEVQYRNGTCQCPVDCPAVAAGAEADLVPAVAVVLLPWPGDPGAHFLPPPADRGDL